MCAAVEVVGTVKGTTCQCHFCKCEHGTVLCGAGGHGELTFFLADCLYAGHWSGLLGGLKVAVAQVVGKLKKLAVGKHYCYGAVEAERCHCDLCLCNSGVGRPRHHHHHPHPHPPPPPSQPVAALALQSDPLPPPRPGPAAFLYHAGKQVPLSYYHFVYTK